mmetsp:Transcript_9167/g.14564  ORF Transcript_9167/g.14564 Transcript_9167/m.14564 type:complete len:212 (+) Transcript_9167:230-865(+)
MHDVLDKSGHKRGPVRSDPITKMFQEVAADKESQLFVFLHCCWLNPLLDYLEVAGEDLGDEGIRVVLHDGARNLAKRNPQCLLLLCIVPIVFHISVLVLLLHRALAALVAPLQRLAEQRQALLADVANLVVPKDPRPGLLQADRDAVCARLEPLLIKLLCFELRQNSLEEFQGQLADHLNLTALSCSAAELPPGFKGQVPDLLSHREIEDW